MRSVTSGAAASSGTVSTFWVARRGRIQRSGPLRPPASSASESAATAAAIAAANGAVRASTLATMPAVTWSASDSAHCGRTQWVSTQAS